MDEIFVFLKISFLHLIIICYILNYLSSIYRGCCLPQRHTIKIYRSCYVVFEFLRLCS